MHGHDPPLPRLGPDHQLECRWDTPPSDAWPAEDMTHWQSVVFPEVVRAVAGATGQRVLGVSE